MTNRASTASAITDEQIHAAEALVFSALPHHVKNSICVSGGYIRDVARAVLALNAPAAHRGQGVSETPVAWLRFWARQGFGSPEFGPDNAEGLEVCEKGEKGDDGSDAFPVYDRPERAAVEPSQPASHECGDPSTINVAPCAACLGKGFTARSPAPAAPSPWQPIETAPKDGTHILVSWPMRLMDDEGRPTGDITRRDTLVTWMNGNCWIEPDYLGASGEWFGDDDCYAADPDLWMPLPAKPAALAASTKGKAS